MAKPERPVTNIRTSHTTDRANRNLQTKQAARRKKHLIQRLVIVGTVFMVIFGVMLTFHIKQRTVQAELETEYEELNDELAGLERQKENMEEEIDLLNDEEYILDIARTNYFLSKKGELIFQTETQKERTY